MLTLSTRAAVVAATVLFIVAQAPARAESTAYLGGEWYLEGEALFLDRSVHDVTTAIGDDGSGPFATGERVQGTDDADLGFEPGGRGTIGLWFDPQTAGELSFMGIAHRGEDAVENVNPSGEDIDARFVDGGFIGGGLLGGDTFGNAARVDLAYDTHLHSVEANYRRRLGGVLGVADVTVLGGGRYIGLDEDLRLRFFDDSVAGEVDFSQDIGILDVETENHLFGLQAGAEATVPLFSNVSLNGRGKAGAYFNRARKQITIDDDDQAAAQFDDDENRVSGAFEGGLFINWHPASNVAIGVGYMAMFLMNVSDAPNQVPLADSEAELTKHHGGNVLYHGAGLHLVWKFGHVKRHR